MSETLPAKEVTDAFAILGNETRLSILRTLWMLPGGTGTFSELHHAVGMRDSGQFNYHLGRLVDRFVVKDDEGYRLTGAGMKVLGAVVQGAYSSSTRIPPYAFDETCIRCDATLLASYEDEQMAVLCPRCPDIRFDSYLPPTIVDDHDRADLPKVFDRWVRVFIDTVRRGFCPNCGSHIDPTLRTNIEDIGVGISYACDRCPQAPLLSPGMFLAGEPEVVSFFHRHGIDLSARPVWQTEFLTLPTGSVVSETPLVVERRIRAGDEVLVATLDGSLAVTYER